MSHYVEGLKKTFWVLRIASDNVARVPLVPMNLTIVSLILCQICGIHPAVLILFKKK